jgi:hypothetical protein
MRAWDSGLGLYGPCSGRRRIINFSHTHTPLHNYQFIIFVHTILNNNDNSLIQKLTVYLTTLESFFVLLSGPMRDSVWTVRQLVTLCDAAHRDAHYDAKSLTDAIRNCNDSDWLLILGTFPSSKFQPIEPFTATLHHIEYSRTFELMQYTSKKKKVRNKGIHKTLRHVAQLLV